VRVVEKVLLNRICFVLFCLMQQNGIEARRFTHKAFEEQERSPNKATQERVGTIA